MVELCNALLVIFLLCIATLLTFAMVGFVLWRLEASEWKKFNEEEE